ncbi:hypothetical protein V493_04889 [Pseudogymnoascus sp. VKM F-4281 (FW-2241)]|nr:hypothetical protein V493_04889 [Pseudogymnoascus sp. VKM F-4281 (FW-2241)]
MDRHSSATVVVVESPMHASTFPSRVTGFWAASGKEAPTATDVCNSGIDLPNNSIEGLGYWKGRGTGGRRKYAYPAINNPKIGSGVDIIRQPGAPSAPTAGVARSALFVFVAHWQPAATVEPATTPTAQANAPASSSEDHSQSTEVGGVGLQSAAPQISIRDSSPQGESREQSTDPSPTMAVESPLISSPANMMSAFSPYTEFSLSPNSPAMPNTPRFQSLSARNSTDASLHPNSVGAGRFSSIDAPSPSDMVGPSPVTSNGTETTDIEDDTVEEEHEAQPAPTNTNGNKPLNSLTTALPSHFRNKLEDEPSSVIHAPQGYLSFANTKNDNPPQQPPNIDRSTPKPFHHEGGPLTIDSSHSGDKTITPSPVSPPPISTDIAPTSFTPDNTTPRAQTRQELDLIAERSRLRSSSASSLEGIPEDARESDENGDIHNDDYHGFPPPNDPDHDVNTLKTALHECWTLCNTLASLSSIHRERIFSYSGTGDAHEQAWKCCWRLCQKLYENRDDHLDFQCRPTLDLCREFCQSLFDVRERNNDLADSVLRVSFELNNHLFNTHDRNLPEAFRERTLDFYITLCHRLMKQRSDQTAETDSLLRACWSLAEMLFSLRQNRLDGKDADVELLGSAVQACWELCDLFREGWTQVRPERGTPRPSQTTFTQSFDQLNRSSHSTHSTHSHHNSNSNSSMSSMSSLPSILKRVEPRRIEPETPTTEFEDTPISPEDHSPSIPNILVLGTENGRSSARWSSNSSNLSGYSQGSNKTSSTAKGTTSEDVNLTRLKILILKAAMNVGFQRNQPANGSVSGPANALQAYVKALPTGSFGSLPWHANLLASYKDLVLSDPTFRSAVTLPSQGKRANALDVSKSVGWMMKSGQYLWLKDLYRLVFGFQVEDAEKRKSLGIVV